MAEFSISPITSRSTPAKPCSIFALNCPSWSISVLVFVSIAKRKKGELGGNKSNSSLEAKLLTPLAPVL